MKNITQNELDAYRAIIFESPMPIAVYTGRELRISLANTAVLRTWEKDRSVVGMLFKDALPEMEDQPFLRILEQVFDSGEEYSAKEELVYLMRNGVRTPFYFNFNYKPLRNAEGQVWGIINTATDVTELVTAKMRADDAESSLQFALDAAEIGTWDLDIQFNEVNWDHRCQEFFGFSKEEKLKYEEIIRYIHRQDKERVATAVARAIDPAVRDSYDIVFRVNNAVSGQVRWLHCIGKAYFSDDNRVLRFSGTTQDITHQKNAERKIESAERMARLAVEGAGAATFVVDESSDEVRYSPSLSYILTGEANQSLTRRDFIDRLHEADILTRRDAYRHAKATGRLNYEARFRWNDGSLHWVRVLGAYDKAENGDREILMGIAYDISTEIVARQEQKKLLSLIETSSEYMAVVDETGKIIYLNEAARCVTGLNVNMNVLSPEALELFDDGMAHLMKTGITSALKSKGRWQGNVNLKDMMSGEQIPCHAELVNIYDDVTGRLVAIGVTLRDLRAEIKSKKALIDSESRFRNMVEHAPVAILMFKGRDMILETVNESMIQLLGHDSEIVGKPFEQALPELVRQPLGEALYKVYHSGLPLHGNDTPVMLSKKGAMEERYLNFSYTPIATQGRVDGVLMIAIDVTEQMIAKKALAEREDLFRSITTASPAALWMSGTDGGMAYFNQTWLDWTGAQKEMLLGFGWLQKIYEEDVDSFNTKYTEDFQKREFHESQFRIHHTDGTLHWLSCTGTPHYGAYGEFLGYIGACVDITELKQLQQQKDDFLGIASHELKTPVTSIKSYIQALEILLRSSGDGVKADMIQKADKQVDRLTNLIGDLLDVTKINSGKLQFNDSFFQFNEVVKEAIEELQRTSQQHEIKFEQDESITRVYGDRERIIQVIVNLLSNAIKYSPDAKDIIVTSQLNDNYVTLSVQDFGIGIAPDKKDRVFEQFYRVSGNRRHTFPGLGLGLYISSQIIKREGGHIWVTSTEGKGSTFSFSIPVDHRVTHGAGPGATII
jgi:PAS domain S-box-containing protein